MERNINFILSHTVIAIIDVQVVVNNGQKLVIRFDAFMSYHAHWLINSNIPVSLGGEEEAGNC